MPNHEHWRHNKKFMFNASIIGKRTLGSVWMISDAAWGDLESWGRQEY